MLTLCFKQDFQGIPLKTPQSSFGDGGDFEILRIWDHPSPFSCAPRQAGGPGDGPSPRHPRQREPPQAHPVAEAAQIPRPGEDGAQPKGIQPQVKAEGSHRARLCLGHPLPTQLWVNPLRGSGAGSLSDPPEQLQPRPAATLGRISAFFLELWDVSVQHPAGAQPPTAGTILLLLLGI